MDRSIAALEAAAGDASRPLTRLLFGAVLVLGAALIFWAELLAARLLLPLLGGGASVWNTSLVFFQIALLAGYLYAHASARWARGRWGPLLHPALLLGAALMLPITAARLAPPGGETNPVLWQLAALALMVGAPFVVMAGTASLLQAWYARLDARDPYFLYAASNLGSLAALLTYPTLIEPNLRLVDQSGLWSAGYLALIGLAFACAVVTLVGRGAIPAAEGRQAGPWAAPATDARGAWLQRARWLVLAFVPSSLLLGVTTHLTMNIAAAPMLWVAPLALYLLSFVLAFQTLVPLPERWTSWLQAVLLVALALTFLTAEAAPSITLFGLNLAAFFATALLCHQRLAGDRPPPARLTEFYLIVALGGALGGAFNALLAPVIFSRVVEYPLMLVVACLLRPGEWPTRAGWRSAVLDLVIPVALAVDLIALAALAGFDLTNLNGEAQVFILIAGLIVFAVQNRPVRFAGTIAALILAGAFAAGDLQRDLAHARNFYGVLRVDDRTAPPVRVLVNGTIEHGAQSLDPARRLQPLSYYHHAGPLGSLFSRIGGGPLTQNVAIVGLGAGSVACYAHAGEHWTFYEINPAVVRIASNPALFTFLRDCPAHPRIVLGDARLSLSRAPDHAFGLILLDAFSSDAIPTHLMTREALRLYRAKLAPGGLILFHISNQFLDLAPVVAGAARAEGLSALEFSDQTSINEGDTPAPAGSTDYKDASDWVVVGPAHDLAPVAVDKGWVPLAPSPGVRPWTDDYSDVFDAFLRRQQSSPSP